ncbi:LacI family transcriptional regulator [Chryseobacterium phosphatilyticum]|uniref:LacI family transcriptional regulator n=1 Tax=Chryseobacterium phosphatilyticum TaxID=475075 RepID=A0A316X2G6_9FLAO|nr:substrate-binding domain-containing protein [Chryseobacterium phosphatilyticum]PWN65100.1 LacI family transcriptional regulator [Chryseobacterium phosphatilyticum]
MTIKEIARLANVSPGTVDRILHNRGGVAESTQKKVVEIIEQAGGFRPNAIARNLALNKIYQVAVLMPLFNAASPFWEYPKKGVLKAIEEVSSFGMKVSVSYFDEFNVDSYSNELDKILKNKTLDGIIIASHFVKETKDRSGALNELNIPYLFLNVPLKGFDNISFVGQDSFGSGRVAAQLFHIVQNTKKPRVLIMEVLEDFENYYGLDQRAKGFVSFFSDHTSHVVVERIRVPNKSTQLFHKLLGESLNAYPDIGGIFFPSNVITKAARYLETHNIHLDMVVGYDVTEENKKFLNKGVITFLIGQEPFQQGYKSIKLMFEHLVHGQDLNDAYMSPIHIVTKENLEYYIH